MSEAVCDCVYRVSSNMDSTAEDKKPFEEEAKKLSAQYKEDKAKYDEENPKQKKRKGDGESSKGSKKAKKDPNAPKAALSAYMLWTASERDNVKKENPDMKPTEIMSKLGSLWCENVETTASCVTSASS